MSRHLTLSAASHDPLWMDALTARCIAEGVPFPGGAALETNLAQGAPKEQLRGRLAQMVLTHWVKGHADVPAWPGPTRLNPELPSW